MLATTLQMLPLYDNLLRQHQAEQGPWERDGNLLRRANSESLRFCHLIDFFVHSFFPPGSPNRTQLGLSALQNVAVQSLALEHLNTGNGRVIPEVEGLDQRCNIKFTMEFIDTVSLPTVAVDRLIAILSRKVTTETSTSSGNTSEANPQPPPCAFLGAFGSQPSMSIALLTSLNGYPQFSGVSQASQLDDKTLFPLFGRYVPSNDQFAQPLVDFVIQKLRATHLAVVFADDTRSISFSNGLRQVVGSQLKLQMVGFADLTRDFSATVQALRETGYRFILAVVRHYHFQPLIEEAHRQGIAGNGLYNWIVTTTVTMGGEHLVNSTFAQSIKGLMEFIAIGALPGIGRYDELVEAWQKLGEDDDDLQYLQSKLPKYDDDPSYNPIFSKDTFNIGVHGATNTFAKMYDLTIGMGLAACAAAMANETSDNTTKPVPLDGRKHYQEMLRTSFIGASGTIQLDQATGSRTSSSTLFVINNHVPEYVVPSINENKTVLKTRRVRTHYFSGNMWHDLVELKFNDETTNIPPDLPPPTMKSNYIGTGLRVTGFAMSITAISASIGFVWWTYTNRKEHVVTASQPLFLYLTCFGAGLMACSIISLSIDDEIAGTKGVNIACMSFPWFFSLGWCVAFSALFTKTRRVNRIFHNPSFRRIVVTPRSVAIPMIGLLLANLLVLTLWTAISPWTWERQVIALDTYGRPSETSGECSSDGRMDAVFFSLLMMINVGVLVVTVQQAYVARKISTEYAESEWIGRCISAIMIVVFIGVPILVIARQEDARTFSFVLSSIAFVISISLLGFILLPKVIMHHEHIRNGNRRRSQLSSGFFTSMESFSRSNSDSFRAGSSEQWGVAVLHHPKFQEYLENRIMALQSQVERLTDQLEIARTENEKLLQHQIYDVIDKEDSEQSHQTENQGTEVDGSSAVNHEGLSNDDGNIHSHGHNT